MKIARLEQSGGKIFVEIPLTEQSGKARVKIRNSFYEYGLPSPNHNHDVREILKIIKSLKRKRKNER